MVFVNTSIISHGTIKLKNHTVNCWEKCVIYEHLSSKKWSNLNFSLLLLVSYIEFDIY